MTSETTSSGFLASPDRIYRSPAGIAGGVVLLAVGAWLGVDAVVSGTGRTPWVALAGLLFVVPLVVAFTVRPAVYANDDRLRVRNPFRDVTLPWGTVGNLRSGYSNEVFDQDGAKYQLWSIPVSLRGRRKAQRNVTRAQSRRGRGAGSDAGTQAPPAQSSGDQAMAELRELCEARAAAESSKGTPKVRWAFEIVVPTLVGAILLAVLLTTG